MSLLFRCISYTKRKQIINWCIKKRLLKVVVLIFNPSVGILNKKVNLINQKSVSLCTYNLFPTVATK